ncbi:MAG: hypothetical protein CME63_06400 [Halobacteriovoraceae bacterium]|nr:hypothetical protein [Halobacteriovoraceae bacterium]
MDRRKLMKSALVLLPVLKAPLLFAKKANPNYLNPGSSSGASKAHNLSQEILSPSQNSQQYFRVHIEVNRFANNGQDREKVKSHYMKGSIKELNDKYLRQNQLAFTTVEKSSKKINWEYAFHSEADYKAWKRELESHYIDYSKAHALGLQEKISFSQC